MKLFTPEISWHNRLPALALDIAPTPQGSTSSSSSTSHRLATGGTDCRVYIWSIDLKGKEPTVTIKAGLRRHMKSVGAVRFSSEGLLASGDDDGYIYIWKFHEEMVDPSPAHIEEVQDIINDDGFPDKETWKQVRVLRGHLEDICDIAWSKDGQLLLSGSIDNSAILWDAQKGCKLWCSTAKGYVQGVALDPYGRFMAALGSDRTLRAFSYPDKRQLYATRRMSLKNNLKVIFCDDTLQTFSRRLEFTPDGQYLIAPSGKIVEHVKQETSQEQDEGVEVDGGGSGGNGTTTTTTTTTTNGNNNQTTGAQAKKPTKSKHAILVFNVSSLSKPIYYYTTGREPALCIRCSPKFYKLREDNATNLWGKPYRMVFAVATTRSVLIYDTQQATPIAFASQMHLARLTDLAWSSDGNLLMIASYDGYCSIMQFDDAIGELCDPVIVAAAIAPPPTVATADGEEEPRKGVKRSKGPKENIKKEKVEVKKEVEVKKRIDIRTFLR